MTNSATLKQSRGVLLGASVLALFSSAPAALAAEPVGLELELALATNSRNGRSVYANAANK
jgi:hypothetical protein